MGMNQVTHSAHQLKIRSKMRPPQNTEQAMSHGLKIRNFALTRTWIKIMAHHFLTVYDLGEHFCLQRRDYFGLA